MLRIAIMMYKPGKAAKHIIIICTDTVNYLYIHTKYSKVLLLKFLVNHSVCNSCGDERSSTLNYYIIRNRHYPSLLPL